MAFDRLFYVRLGDCPAGLEPSAVARNRRKATVKIRRNAPFKRRCHERDYTQKINYNCKQQKYRRTNVRNYLKYRKAKLLNALKYNIY